MLAVEYREDDHTSPLLKAEANRMASVSCEVLCSIGSSFQMPLQKSSPWVIFRTSAVFESTDCHGLNSKMGSYKGEGEDVTSLPVCTLYVQGASLSAR